MTILLWVGLAIVSLWLLGGLGTFTFWYIYAYWLPSRKHLYRLPLPKWSLGRTLRFMGGYLCAWPLLLYYLCLLRFLSKVVDRTAESLRPIDPVAASMCRPVAISIFFDWLGSLESEIGPVSPEAAGVEPSAQPEDHPPEQTPLSCSAGAAGRSAPCLQG